MNWALKIMTGLVRTGYWGGLSLMRGWGKRESVFPSSGRVIEGHAQMVATPLPLLETTTTGALLEPTDMPRITEDKGRQPLLGQAVIRYGEGFSVVCHCYPEEGRVVRTLWLDYTRLRRRYGAWVERRLRLRAGGAVSRQQALPHQGRLDSRPWGRIALTETQLTFASLQDQTLIRLVEQTVEEGQQLVDAEVPDGLLHKRPWRLLPPAPMEAMPVEDTQKRRQVIDMTMAELRSADARRKTPLASQQKVYPNMVKTPDVRRFKGVLSRTGFVERRAESGKKTRQFFAEVSDDVQTVRHTGTDLQQALLREEIEEGDTVEIFAIGLVPIGKGRAKKQIWSARKVS